MPKNLEKNREINRIFTAEALEILKQASSGASRHKHILAIMPARPPVDTNFSSTLDGLAPLKL